MVSITLRGEVYSNIWKSWENVFIKVYLKLINRALGRLENWVFGTNCCLRQCLHYFDSKALDFWRLNSKVEKVETKNIKFRLTLRSKISWSDWFILTTDSWTWIANPTSKSWSFRWYPSRWSKNLKWKNLCIYRN